MTICWFGIYDPNFGRNKIFREALEQAGHKILDCRGTSAGLAKYWRLYREHKKIKNSYDVLVVGYPGHIVTPLAKIISTKRVVVDALGSLYDAEISSHYPSWWRRVKNWLADWLMVIFADRIMLESEAQKKYFVNKFRLSNKYFVVYTGASQIFSQSNLAKKMAGSKFVILFRGKLTPESGIEYVLEAAKLLKNNPNINFKIIGSGYLLKKVKYLLGEYKLNNVTLNNSYLSDQELVGEYEGAGLALGQFGNNPRLNRTIPHKAFEALATGTAYLTGDTPASREILRNGETAFFVPLADAGVLAKKIEILSSDREATKMVGQSGRALFEQKFGPVSLVERLKQVML